MADNSWDNSGLPPEKKGMATWLKVLLGCGVAALLVMGACTGGCIYLGQKIKKDPEGFGKAVEAHALSFAADMVKRPWEAMHSTFEQLKTDEGARKVYTANPGLASRYPTEAEFLKAAQSWRPKLDQVPREIPDLKSHDISFNKNFGGATLRYRHKEGARVEITWDSGDLRQITDLTVE